MNQVGQIVTFTLQGAPADGGGFTYVWKWWDGSVSVTTVPIVQKQLNIGSVTPLAYSVTVADDLGNSSTTNATIVVNAPPVVLSPSISQNDQAFGYQAVMTTKAYDPEHTQAAFLWYNSGTALGAGSSIYSGGTGTNTFNFTVNQDTQLRLLCIDYNGSTTDAGTTPLNFQLRGFDPAGLQASSSAVSNSIIANTNNLPSIVIGPGQTVNFTAYAQDSEPGRLIFDWAFYGSNGWVADFFYADQGTHVDSGARKSVIGRDISGETSGEKLAVCNVTNIASGQTVQVQTTVELLQSFAPVISNISTSLPFNGATFNVPRTSYLLFTGTASDDNNDLLTFRWDFTQPSGVVLWGRTVFIQPADYSVFSASGLVGGPRPITGNLTVADRFNQTDVKTIESFVIVQVTAS